MAISVWLNCIGRIVLTREIVVTRCVSGNKMNPSLDCNQLSKYVCCEATIVGQLINLVCYQAQTVMLILKFIDWSLVVGFTHSITQIRNVS